MQGALVVSIHDIVLLGHDVSNIVMCDVIDVVMVTQICDLATCRAAVHKLSSVIVLHRKLSEKCMTLCFHLVKAYKNRPSALV
jgi:hypothetical protein